MKERILMAVLGSMVVGLLVAPWDFLAGMVAMFVYLAIELFCAIFYDD